MTEDEYNMDELIMKRMMTLRALSYECWLWGRLWGQMILLNICELHVLTSPLTLFLSAVLGRTLYKPGRLLPRRNVWRSWFGR
jgi:hypothetical protein